MRYVCLQRAASMPPMVCTLNRQHNCANSFLQSTGEPAVKRGQGLDGRSLSRCDSEKDQDATQAYRLLVE